LDFEIKMKK